MPLPVKTARSINVLDPLSFGGSNKPAGDFLSVRRLPLRV